MKKFWKKPKTGTASGPVRETVLVEPAPGPLAAPTSAPVREEPPTPSPAAEHHQDDVQEEQARPEPTPPAASTPAPSAVPASTGPVASWPWLTPTRIMIAAAAVPSVLSLVWLATTVAEIAAGPEGDITVGGLATGVFADVLIVSTVLVGWFMPSVRQTASIGGWVAAVGAAGLLAYHYWGTEQLAFAVVPLGAKFLWHLALQARTVAEQELSRRAADDAKAAKAEAEKAEKEKAEAVSAAADEADADDCSLTVAQRRTIADLKREAEFAKKEADAKAAKAEATIYATQRVDMATDKAEAERLKARFDLAAEVGGRLPIQLLAQFLPDLPGVTTEVTEVRRDRSQINAAPAGTRAAEAIPAGFGAGLIDARASIGGIGADLGGGATAQDNAAPDGIGGTTGAQAHHEARRAAGEATRQLVLEAIEKHGPDITTNALADLLGKGRSTVRAHRTALAKAGYDVLPDQQK